MSVPKPAQTLLRNLPVALVERTAQFMLHAILKRHTGLVERLGPFAKCQYGFTPTDMPFNFVVTPVTGAISVRRDPVVQPADVYVSGSIVTLLALLEGRVDGDAVFFGRHLTISGDTEAVLALRNTIEDLELDLPNDIAAQAGLFAPVVRRAGQSIRREALKAEGLPWN